MKLKPKTLWTSGGHISWIGRKKIAFIPVFRPNAHPPDVILADCNSDILRRVLFDPDKRTGADGSLRAFIHAASSRLANFDAVVMPPPVRVCDYGLVETILRLPEHLYNNSKNPAARQLPCRHEPSDLLFERAAAHCRVPVHVRERPATSRLRCVRPILKCQPSFRFIRRALWKT
jgi:hypothetical protein